MPFDSSMGFFFHEPSGVASIRLVCIIDNCVKSLNTGVGAYLTCCTCDIYGLYWGKNKKTQCQQTRRCNKSLQ